MGIAEIAEVQKQLRAAPSAKCDCEFAVAAVRAHDTFGGLHLKRPISHCRKVKTNTDWPQPDVRPHKAKERNDQTYHHAPACPCHALLRVAHMAGTAVTVRHRPCFINGWEMSAIRQ